MYPEITLEAFQGPMDLLLYLIEKNKLDIYDIPIAEITDQYLEYLKESEPISLDSVSEFIVMAARLLELKARSLLPYLQPQEEEEIKEELSRKLVEYKIFKEISKTFSKMEEAGKQKLYHAEDLPKEVWQYTEPANIEKLLEPVSLDLLKAIYNRLSRQKKERTDTVRGGFERIADEEVKTGDKMIEILKYCQHQPEFPFEKLIHQPNSKIEVVAAFLAMLELSREEKILIFQEERFGRIIIRKR